MTERFDGGGHRLFPIRGEIAGIGVEGKVFRDWTTRRGATIASGEMYPE
jgi:hypothetical protein